MLGGASPVAVGRHARLDPLALPVRFMANDAVADGRERFVEIDRSRVLVRRRVRGMAIRLNVPIEAFLGVSVRLAQTQPGEAEQVVVRLEHRDPALAVQLFVGPDDAEVIAEWQLWARVLGLPLLIADLSGNLVEPFPRLGALALSSPSPRRRRRNAVRKRRPTQPLRRRPGDAAKVQPVHREREIIARE
jgi:uncharacterized membrane protein